MKAITINLPEEVELDKVKMIIAASLFEQGILSSGQGIQRRKSSKIPLPACQSLVRRAGRGRQLP